VVLQSIRSTGIRENDELRAPTVPGQAPIFSIYTIFDITTVYISIIAVVYFNFYIFHTEPLVAVYAACSAKGLHKFGPFKDHCCTDTSVTFLKHNGCKQISS